MEDGRSAFKMLIGKPTGKRPLEWPRHSWKGHIGMKLKEIGVKRRIGLIWLRIGVIREPM